MRAVAVSRSRASHPFAPFVVQTFAPFVVQTFAPFVVQTFAPFVVQTFAPLTISMAWGRPQMPLQSCYNNSTFQQSGAAPLNIRGNRKLAAC